MPIASNAALRLSIALVALLAGTAAFAQQSFSTLEERMTGKEFREAGLHKLSDEELAALNRWIKARSLTEGEAIELVEGRGSDSPGGDRRGFNDGGSDEPIVSRIPGTFKGWSGNTEFELENGMVWRQAESGTFSIGETENPRVTIEPGMFSSWYLSVEGYNRRVRVKRIR